MFVPLSKKPTAVAFSVQWSFRLFCKMNVFEPSTVRTNTNLPKSSAIDQSPHRGAFCFLFAAVITFSAASPRIGQLSSRQEQLKKELEPPAAEQAAFASEQVVPPCSIQ